MRVIDSRHEAEKTRNLVLGLFFDAIGMLSFSIPWIGEFGDVVWAPVSGVLMAWMYKGKRGKVAAAVSVLEELIWFTDIVPTFTLMWFWTYGIRGRKTLLPKDKA